MGTLLLSHGLPDQAGSSLDPRPACPWKKEVCGTYSFGEWTDRAAFLRGVSVRQEDRCVVSCCALGGSVRS